MKCINCQSLPSPLLPQLKRKHHVRPSIIKHGIVQLNRNGLSSASLTRTAALPTAVSLATNLPTAGKLSVLLQTGGVCLVAYWIANFVVPEMVLKDLQNKTDEDRQNRAEDES